MVEKGGKQRAVSGSTFCTICCLFRGVYIRHPICICLYIVYVRIFTRICIFTRVFATIYCFAVEPNSLSVSKFTCIGRGGAGRGGGCFAFFGGSAGLGDSGRGGGPVFDPKPEPAVCEREKESE